MTIYDFTEEERHAIDDMLKRNLENLTPEEVKLYAKWEAALAIREEEFQNRQEALKAESQARIKSYDTKAKAAKKNLSELKKAALERLERI